jgi:NDP-sugar pyrophosphorylase family protein
MSVFPNAGAGGEQRGDRGRPRGPLRHGVRRPTLDHIDYGATALRRSVIEALPPDEPWGLDAIQADLAARGQLRALVAPERFYEIGSESGLAEAERALGGGR